MLNAYYGLYLVRHWLEIRRIILFIYFFLKSLWVYIFLWKAPFHIFSFYVVFFLNFSSDLPAIHAMLQALLLCNDQLWCSQILIAGVITNARTQDAMSESMLRGLQQTLKLSLLHTKASIIMIHLHQETAATTRTMQVRTSQNQQEQGPRRSLCIKIWTLK